MDYIPRSEYLDWLYRWKDKKTIKIVSGVRRCGKSTLLSIFQEQLLANGVDQDRVVSINFEDIENESLTDYHTLHSYLVSRLSDETATYIFLDEVQNVDQFEKVLDSLYVRSNCDLYVTGSNAYLLSSELATLLTGRYVELKMLPLSFKEYCLGMTKTDISPNETLFQDDPVMKDSLFASYMETGGFPYVLALKDNRKNVIEYLHDIYRSILFKDIVARMKINDAPLLERVGKTLASEVGGLVSISKIANTIRSSGRKADQKTIDKYVGGFTESMLFYEVPRWDVKGRKLLSRIAKYYIVDVGLRRNLIEGSASDIGHLLENVIYLELKRRNGAVYVGSIGASEIDFVAIDDERIHYYQVAASVLDEKTLRREITALKATGDDHPKTLLTLDRILPATNIDGIKIVNAIDWLLDAD